MTYKIGVDVGGTFTDILFMAEDGSSEIYKVLSTPQDPSIGFMNGLQEIAQRRGASVKKLIKEVEIIVHGTTVTTNAVLTEKGATTGLLTTKGFRDALQMRRGIREELYNNKYVPPKPLVPRYLRLPVEERVDYKGDILTPLKEEDVWEGIHQFKENGVEAIAICFMHSYANKTNEEQASAIVRQGMPDAYLTPSYELLPQIRFYDRVSTTVLNAYVGPILRGYLTNLTQKLNDVGFEGVLLIMQSNGGVMSPQVAIQAAGTTLLSGPAAGPIAGMTYAGVLGFRDCITIDMGGTSFDAALVKDLTPLVTTEGRINRLLLALPMLGIHTIGAGGGSIGWIDEGGLLRMGPQSAGASPGPACYGLGGEEPTCTDADLILGYLNKDFFLRGKMPLDEEKAKAAIQKLGKGLGMDLVQTAAGMYQVINANMAAGIREVSVERGFDPREFPLVVAGGAGPIHAGMIATELEIPFFIVPKESSIFCAVGMLLTDLKHDFVRTYHSSFDQLDRNRFLAFMEEMEKEGKRVLHSENIPEERISFQYSCDMRYIGQYHEVNVTVSREDIWGNKLEPMLASFHDDHDRLYGYSIPDAPTEVINLRLRAIGITEKPRFREDTYRGKDVSSASRGKRPVYLPREKRYEEIPVYDGDVMGYGNQVQGPAIIEQATTTVFVPPEFTVSCDRYGSYAMYLTSRAAEFEGRILTK